MTWKLAFTLIVIMGGVLTGLAPLFLFTDFRAELGVGTMLLGMFVGIMILLSAGVPIGFASGVLGAVVIWLNFGLPETPICISLLLVMFITQQSTLNVLLQRQIPG